MLAAIEQLVDGQALPLGAQVAPADQQLDVGEVVLRRVEDFAVGGEEEQRHQNVDDLDDAHGPGDHGPRAEEDADHQVGVVRYVVGHADHQNGGPHLLPRVDDLVADVGVLGEEAPQRVGHLLP